MAIAELVVGGKIAELVAGAVLGLCFTIIYDSFRKEEDTKVINRLRATINRTRPLMDQIGKRSKVEGSPLREVHERLTRLLDSASDILKAYTELRYSRHVRTKYRYIKELEVKELALIRILAEIQVDPWADTKEMKAELSEMHAELSEMHAEISEMHAKISEMLTKLC